MPGLLGGWVLRWLSGWLSVWLGAYLVGGVGWLGYVRGFTWIGVGEIFIGAVG